MLELRERKRMLCTEISALKFLWFLGSPSRGREPGRIRNENDVSLVVRGRRDCSFLLGVYFV